MGNDLLVLALKDTQDVATVQWQYTGYQNGNSSEDEVILDLQQGTVQDELTPMLVTLRVQDEFGCVNTDQINYQVNQVIARFSMSNLSNAVVDSVCENEYVDFNDLSQYADKYEYRIGSYYIGDIADFGLNQDYPGTHEVWLSVRNDLTGCTDTTMQTITVMPKPNLESQWDTICPFVPTQLNVPGAVDYFWKPSTYLSNRFIANPNILIQSKVEYWVIGLSDFRCEDSTKVIMDVFDVNPPVSYSINRDMTIGDTLYVVLPENPDYSYSWPIEEDLSCYACDSNRIIIDDNQGINFVVTAEDKFGCFVEEYPININVREEYSVDFPDGFTPNGDGINEKIFPRGLGIEEFISVRIFDRRGTLLFEGKGQDNAWDGTYQGKALPAGTYSYNVQVKFYQDNKIETKTGVFKLIR